MQNDTMLKLLSKVVDSAAMKKTIWKLKGEINDALRIDSIHADIVAEHFEAIKGMEEAAARYRVLERRFDDVADLVCVYFDDLADDVDEDEEKVIDVLGKLRHMYTIKDMKLEEISSEDVVKKIYEEGVK